MHREQGGVERDQFWGQACQKTHRHGPFTVMQVRRGNTPATAQIGGHRRRLTGRGGEARRCGARGGASRGRRWSGRGINERRP
jgi:hypothetical protein